MKDDNAESMKTSELRERLADFQSTLIDRTWSVTVILAVIGLVNNGIAIYTTGRAGAFIVNIAMCLLIIAGYFVLDRIPFTAKVVTIIILQVVLGFANFVDGGMFGAGWFWFVSASFLVAVFYSIRAGIIGLGLFALVVLYVGVGYVDGSLTTTFDINIRARDIGTWVNFFTVVILVSMVILYMIGGYLKAIQELLSEVNRQRAQAESASRAKSEFLANMSQELRTPLTNMLAHAEQIAVDPTANEPQKQHVHEIDHSGKLLLGLIDDLLDLQRIETGKLKLEKQDVTVGSMTAKSFKLLADAAQHNGVALVDEGGDGANAVVRADPIRLLQVIWNLLSNAIKYNLRGGSAHLSYSMRNDGRVRITVRDSGRGIPEDKLLRVFRPFDRLGFESTEIEGRGIGLLMSKRIVEAMGGTIGFNSVEGKGSSFWVEFDTVAAPAP